MIREVFYMQNGKHRTQYSCQILRIVLILSICLIMAGCAVFGGTKPVSQGEVRFHIQEGDKYVGEGNYSLAAKSYAAAVKLDPNSIDSRAKLGEAYANLGQTDQALAEFAMITELKPDYVQAYNYKGYLYYSQEKYDEAAKEFAGAVAAEPENLYSLNYLGLSYKMLGRLDDAESALQKAVDLDPEMDTPDSRDTHNFLGLVYQEQEKYDKAIAEFNKTLEHFPEDADAYVYMGAALQNSKRYSEAVEAYTRALEYNPNDTFAATKLAELKQQGWETPPDPVGIVEDDPEYYINNAPDASEYPNSGAIILLDKFSYDFSDGGVARYTIHKIVKIFDERGIMAYGEMPPTPFNYMSQEIGVNIARTILPDGKVVESSPDAYHVITPPGLSDYNLYSDIRYHVISMPALQPGAIIEYKVTVEDIAPTTEMSWILGGMFFQWLDPILAAKCVLRVPADTQIKWKLYNSQAKPVITRDDDGRLTYIWITENVQEFVPETAMPPMDELIPYLIFSTAESWDDVYNWYKELSKPQETANKDIKRKVAELVVGKGTKAQKTKAIFEFVASEIRYVAIELGMGAYVPYSAIDVFKNRYGDCKDKVTLLISMLREANIDAYPVLISPSPRRRVDTELPSIGQFSHVIAAVKVEDDGYVWLDPTISTCKYGDLPAGDQGRKAFVIEKDNGEFIETPVFPSKANLTSLSSEIAILDNGAIEGWEQTTVNGQMDIYLRSVYRMVRPDRLTGFMEGILNPRYPGIKIEDVQLSDVYNMDTPMEVKVNFSCPAYATDLPNMLVFPLPNEQFSAYANLVGSAERRHDLELGYNMAIKKALTLKLPPGYTAVSLPEDTSIECEFGEFLRKYEAIDDSMVKYSVSLKIDIPAVPVGKYASFKNLIETAAREDRAQIILTKSSPVTVP